MYENGPTLRFELALPGLKYQVQTFIQEQLPEIEKHLSDAVNKALEIERSEVNTQLQALVAKEMDSYLKDIVVRILREHVDELRELVTARVEDEIARLSVKEQP